MAKIKAICWQNTNQPLDVLLIRLSRFLRGWTAHCIRLFQRDSSPPAGPKGLWTAAPQTPAQHVEATPSPHTSERWWPATRDGNCSQTDLGHAEQPLPRNTDSQPWLSNAMRWSDGTCGEPDARKRARPVRRAGTRKLTGDTLTPGLRPDPTAATSTPRRGQRQPPLVVLGVRRPRHRRVHDRPGPLDEDPDRAPGRRHRRR